MRTVAKPVAIITTRRQDIEDDREGTLAATVSSFDSVCMEPEICVSFNLRQASSTYKTIVDSGYFCITFPKDNRAGAKLAHKFVKGNETSPFGPDGPMLLSLGEHGEGVKRNLKHVPKAVTLTDLAYKHKSGFAFAFTCEYSSSTPVGDHVIVTGRVLPHSINAGGLSHGWGRSVKYGNAYAESHVTLSHLHGAYSDRANCGSTESSWKLADPMRNDDLDALAGDPALLARNLYRQHLEVIGLARMLQKGDDLNSADFKHIKMDNVRRAASLGRILLTRYESYYRERLATLRVKTKEATTTNNGAAGADPDFEVSEELKQWQKWFVIDKMTRSREYLHAKEDFCLQRLQELRQLTNGTSEPMLDNLPNTNDEEAAPSGYALHDAYSDTGLASAAAQSSVVSFFETYLKLIREAKRRLTTPRITTTEKKDASIKNKGGKWVSGFTSARDNYTLQELQDEYQLYQKEASETLMSLLQVSNGPMGRDRELSRAWKTRYNKYLACRDVLAELITERIKSNSKEDTDHMPTDLHDPKPFTELSIRLPPKVLRRFKAHQSQRDLRSLVESEIVASIRKYWSGFKHAPVGTGDPDQKEGLPARVVKRFKQYQQQVGELQDALKGIQGIDLDLEDLDWQPSESDEEYKSFAERYREEEKRRGPEAMAQMTQGELDQLLMSHLAQLKAKLITPAPRPRDAGPEAKVRPTLAEEALLAVAAPTRELIHEEADEVALPAAADDKEAETEAAAICAPSTSKASDESNSA